MRLWTKQASTHRAKHLSVYLENTGGIFVSLALHNFLVPPRNPTGVPNSWSLDGGGASSQVPTSQTCCREGCQWDTPFPWVALVVEGRALQGMGRHHP